MQETPLASARCLAKVMCVVVALLALTCECLNLLTPTNTFNMTAIVIWGNYENLKNPTLWVAADSRVSRNDNGKPLIDDAVKVFSLPILCKGPDEEGFFSKPYYIHSLGFCFAGNTLMGQNSYTGLLPLLSNLNSIDFYIPSMQEIANYILHYLKKTFDDYKQVAYETSLFEAAVFGYCHKSSNLSIFHFRPSRQSGIFELEVTAHHDIRENQFIYLGDHSKEMIEKIRCTLDNFSKTNGLTSRVPYNVIRDTIRDENYQSIGGDVQLGIAGKYGFQPMAIVKPRKWGEPEAYFSYLGRELTEETSWIGKTHVGINGMTF